MKILSADYVLPISAPVISKGAVAIEGEKIAAVGKASDLEKRFPEAQPNSLGESVIMPGLINCHAHLEVTIFRGLLDRFDDDFASWLINLTKIREAMPEEELMISAELGVLEGIKAGVTCFADIGRFGAAGFAALQKYGLRGIEFQETEFSPDNRTAKTDFYKLEEKFLKLREAESDRVMAAISPHAPYTVSPKLFEMIADYSLSKTFPLTIHIAESDPERALLMDDTGFFKEFYERGNISWESPRSSSVRYLADLGVLEAKPILAHCIKVSERDIELIRESGSSIVHCPKSNAKFGHGIAPLAKFVSGGIRVGLGTDSMASNNSCDLFEEARFALLMSRAHFELGAFVTATEIMRALTLGGAETLGLEDMIGSIEVGKQADLIGVSISNLAQHPIYDVASALVFATNAGNVNFTMVAGQKLYAEAGLVVANEAEIKAKVGEVSKRIAGV